MEACLPGLAFALLFDGKKEFTIAVRAETTPLDDPPVSW
jgi:hypothetical protein